MSELLPFFGPNCGGVLRWVLPRGRRGARRARVDQVPSGQRRLRGWSSPAALWACELLLLPGAEPSELPVLAVASLCETVRGIDLPTPPLSDCGSVSSIWVGGWGSQMGTGDNPQSEEG